LEKELVLVEKKEAIAILRLNRPEVLNALDTALLDQLAGRMEQLDQDESVRVMILTGNAKAFAAGGDIEEMAESTPVDFLIRPFFAAWGRMRKIQKPVIAAVSGFALGGGNELAMLCDMIVATESARFGQPEINLGVIPGAGGTQRLTRAVGKAKAMEMILTGRPISAREALEWGLINRVVEEEKLEDEAMKLALEIARKSPLAVRMAKQAILAAQDVSLEHGLQFEQNAFILLFSSEDQSEGMQAFMEKRKPSFKGR